MTMLEKRYRSALRMLPASYRDVWEEEMVATFLESVETGDAEDDAFTADYGRPSWSEVASIAALGARLHLGGTGASPRSVARGGAVRLVALMGLLTYAVVALVGVGIDVWLTGKVPWVPEPSEEWARGASADVWGSVWTGLGLLWVLAYCALVLGRWRAARVLTALAAALFAIKAIALMLRSGPLLVGDWSYLLLSAVLVLALAAFHREAPPVRRRPWLLALPIGTAMLSGALILSWPTADQVVPLLDWPGLCCVAVVAAAAVYLAGTAVAQRLAGPAGGSERRTAAWPLALALAAVIVLGMRVVSMLDYVLISAYPGRSTLIAGSIVEAAAVLAIGIPLAVLANRALRSLPATVATAAPAVATVPPSAPAR